MSKVILNICLVAIALSLFKLLVPNNKFKKQVHFLIICFFASSILFLIGNSGFQPEDFTAMFSSNSSFVDFSSEITNQRRREIAEELSQQLNEMLVAEGIVAEKIHVIVHIHDMYSISINEIKLVLPESCDTETRERAASIVQKEVGATISVSIQ